MTTCLKRPLLCFICICSLQPSFQPAKISFYWRMRWTKVCIIYSIVNGAGQWVRWETWMVKSLEVWKTVKHATWGYERMPHTSSFPRKFWVLEAFRPYFRLSFYGNKDKIILLLVVSLTNNNDCSIRVCGCSIRVSWLIATRHACLPNSGGVISTAYTEYIYHQF